MQQQRVYDLIFIVLFLVLLAAPMVAGYLQPDLKISTAEKRRLTQFPDLKNIESIDKLFDDLSSYTSDQFGFRENLLNLDTSIKYLFNVSPVDNVKFGKSGWIFYKTHDPLHIYKVPKAQIINNLQTRVTAVSDRADYLQKKGIPYVYTVIPNKMTMYSDFLPAVYGLTELNSSYDYFTDKLKQRQPDIFFDSMSVLFNSKDNEYEEFIYYQYDTHWNQLGAYYAMSALQAHVDGIFSGTDLTPKKRDFTPQKQMGGDLANMIGLGKKLWKLEPKTHRRPCAQRSNAQFDEMDLGYYECGANALKLLMIGDSFLNNAVPYMAEGFGKVTLAKQGISQKRLEKILEYVQPDIVIEEIGQRNLGKKM